MSNTDGKELYVLIKWIFDFEQHVSPRAEM